jgi:hypothetical protein
MDRKHLAWLPTGKKEPDLPKISNRESKGKVTILPPIDAPQDSELPDKSGKTKSINNAKTGKKEGTVTLKIPSVSVKKFPIWAVMTLIIVGGSMSVGIPTLASLDLTSLTSGTPPVNVDSKTFVVSRVRFDPTSTITMDGATAAGATAVFTQVVKANFLAEMGDIITISGIKVQNLGSTNAIAAVEVIAPQGISVDVRSPSGAGNELRLLGVNTFALPIDAGTSTTPGSAVIELRLIILTGPLDPTTSQQFSIEVGISALD